MKYIWFLFFITQLSTKLTLSTIRMFTLFLPSVYPIAAALGVAVWLGASTLLHSPTQLLLQANTYLAQPSFAHYTSYLKALNTINKPLSEQVFAREKSHLSSPQITEVKTTLAENPDIQVEITFWKNILQLQPTDRDVLWNLALLSSAVGDTKAANEYLAQAKLVDPNYHFPELKK